VGRTRYREHLYPLRPYTKEEALAVVRQAEAFQEKMLKAHGTRFVFPSDEFYQLAGLPIPDADSYEDFPQYENGVGLLARLRDEFETSVRLDPDETENKPRRVIMATGTSVAPFMQELVNAHPVKNVEIIVKPIVNRFFGESITVAGLLTGKDMSEQLNGRELGDLLLIPETTLRAERDLFLCGMSPDQLSQQLHVPVSTGGKTATDLLNAILGVTPPEWDTGEPNQ
jgi:NifB/MoaA-like Fe-S oxidoreductase